MFSLALIAVVLFLGLTLSTAVRESMYGYYLQYYTDPRLARRLTAHTARVVAALFNMLFYICLVVAICAFIYAGVLVVAYGLELFETLNATRPG